MLSIRNKKDDRTESASKAFSAQDARPFTPLLIKDRSILSMNEMLDVLYYSFNMGRGYANSLHGGLDEMLSLAQQQNDTVVQIARTMAAAQKYNIELNEQYDPEKILPQLLGEMSLHGRRLGMAMRLLLIGSPNYSRTYQTTVAVFTTVRRLVATQEQHSAARLRLPDSTSAIESVTVSEKNESNKVLSSSDTETSFRSDRPFFAISHQQEVKAEHCEAKHGAGEQHSVLTDKQSDNTSCVKTTDTKDTDEKPPVSKFFEPVTKVEISNKSAICSDEQNLKYALSP